MSGKLKGNKRPSSRAIRDAAREERWKPAEEFRLEVEAMLQISAENGNGAPDNIFRDNPDFDPKTYMDSQWKAIDAVRQRYRPGPPFRTDDMKANWDSPFLAVMSIIGNGGGYPPPDLMWAIYENFMNFMGGEVDLETALIGPHAHKSLGYRERHSQKRKQWVIAEVLNDFMFLMGVPQLEAAETLLDIAVGGIEPTDGQRYYLALGNEDGDIEPKLSIVRQAGASDGNSLVKWARQSGWLAKSETPKERHQRAFGTHNKGKVS